MKNMCQSCSMPMNKDPKKGGTEKDGSKSEKYCSLCYDKGKFRDNMKTPQEMQEFCIKVMKEQGMPGFLAWILTRGIPKLERWNKK